MYLGGIFLEVGDEGTDGVLVFVKPADVVSKDSPEIASWSGDISSSFTKIKLFNVFNWYNIGTHTKPSRRQIL